MYTDDMATLPILIPSQALAKICQPHHVARLAAYGSIVTEHFSENSDIDLLVEFLPGKKPSLLGLGQLQMALTTLLGRFVDLKTPEFISTQFRQAVIDSAQTIYEHSD